MQPESKKSYRKFEEALNNFYFEALTPEIKKISTEDKNYENFLRTCAYVLERLAMHIYRTNTEKHLDEALNSGASEEAVINAGTVAMEHYNRILDLVTPYKCSRNCQYPIDDTKEITTKFLKWGQAYGIGALMFGLEHLLTQISLNKKSPFKK